jgi:sucrose-phosphate synthase
MSTGLPAVVTQYGGPKDVLEENNEVFGVLIDVQDDHDIARGLLEARHRYDYYQKQGELRVFSKYTWKQTAKHYLQAISDLQSVKKAVQIPKYFYSHNASDLDRNYLKRHYLNQ